MDGFRVGKWLHHTPKIENRSKSAKLNLFLTFSQSVLKSFKLAKSFLLAKVGRIYYICSRKVERALFLIALRVVCQARQTALFCVTFGVTLVSLYGKCNFSVTFLI